MKTKQIIKLTLYILLVCGQTVSAQYYYEKSPHLDTSKINYEVINPENKYIYYHLSDVNNMYFYDFDTTKAVSATGLQMYVGSLGDVHYFENAKKYRYHITDNEIFNRLLPGCDFYYELTENADERVVAQYNGKLFRYEDFNYLVREMDKGGLPQTALSKILAQWRLWVFDQDVHIMSMDTVMDQIPGKRYKKPNSDDFYIYNSDYQIEYEGNMEIDGNTCDFTVVFKQDQRTIQYISIKYKPIGNRYAQERLGVRCFYNKIYLTRTERSNLFKLEQGTEIEPLDQEQYKCYYYDNSINTTQFLFSDFQNLGNNTQFKIYQSTGIDLQSDNLDCVYTSPDDIHVEEAGAVFQLSNANLISGIYVLKYRDQNNIWRFIDNVVLIPEDIDATHTIAGTDFTLEIKDIIKNSEKIRYC